VQSAFGTREGRKSGQTEREDRGTGETGVRDREKEEGVEDKNSGGHTVYVSPGLQIVMAKRWVFEASYHRAVYHNLNGKQLGENYKANGAVTYLF